MNYPGELTWTTSPPGSTSVLDLTGGHLCAFRTPRNWSSYSVLDGISGAVRCWVKETAFCLKICCVELAEIRICPRWSLFSSRHIPGRPASRDELMKLPPKSTVHWENDSMDNQFWIYGYFVFLQGGVPSYSGGVAWPKSFTKSQVVIVGLLPSKTYWC